MVLKETRPMLVAGLVLLFIRYSVFPVIIKIVLAVVSLLTLKF